jgi:hypothetical protein
LHRRGLLSNRAGVERVFFHFVTGETNTKR